MARTIAKPTKEKITTGSFNNISNKFIETPYLVSMNIINKE